MARTVIGEKIVPLLPLLVTLLALWPIGADAISGPRVVLPPTSLAPEQLGVIVNTSDPLSVKIGTYYAQIRKIPRRNVVEISIPPSRPDLDPKIFATIKAELDRTLPDQVQALALTWAAPYRVGCMSATMAFAAGYDSGYCARGCNATKTSPLFNADSVTPHDDFGLRPCMTLGTTDFASSKALIDRGAASDGSWPGNATAYLMDTSDAARNVRRRFYPHIVTEIGRALPIKRVHADTLRGKYDVLFYFTGLPNVKDIETNNFVPGAIADHLTSAGGQLTGSRQMSAMRWILAGATGSYGTVVEPCNFVEKFPNPFIVIARYMHGEPLVLAYWKSVAMPGQGIFIGDPLACPFGGYTLRAKGGHLELTTWSLRPGLYSVVASETGEPPYRAIMMHVPVRAGRATIPIPENEATIYRFVREK